MVTGSGMSGRIAVIFMGGTFSPLSSRPSEARAGIHNHQCLCYVELALQSQQRQAFVVMGPGVRRDDERGCSRLTPSPPSANTCRANAASPVCRPACAEVRLRNLRSSGI